MTHPNLSDMTQASSIDQATRVWLLALLALPPHERVRVVRRQLDEVDDGLRTFACRAAFGGTVILGAAFAMWIFAPDALHARGWRQALALALTVSNAYAAISLATGLTRWGVDLLRARARMRAFLAATLQEEHP